MYVEEDRADNATLWYSKYKVSSGVCFRVEDSCLAELINQGEESLVLYASCQDL